MAERNSNGTEIKLMKKDIKYIRLELDEVKKLIYWILGIFTAMFMFLIATVIGAVVIK